MLENVATFAAHDVKSDAQIEQGNRLMLYLHCCLAGRAYPYGSLPADQAARVPLEVVFIATFLLLFTRVYGFYVASGVFRFNY